MTKKILVCFIIVMILLSYISKSFGVISNIATEMKTFDSGTNRDEDVLKYLKDNFGYEGSTIPKELKVDGKLQVKAHSNNTGGTNGSDVYFYPKSTSATVALNNTNPNVAGIDEGTLKSTYGYPSDQINESEKWDGVIIVGVSEGGGSANNELNYQITIKKLYTGSDYETGLAVQVDDSPAETPATHGLQEGQDNAQEFFDFVGNFMKNPAGTLFTVLFDGLLRVFDVIQIVANLFETVHLNTAQDITTVYNYNYLAADTTRWYSPWCRK